VDRTGAVITASFHDGENWNLVQTFENGFTGDVWLHIWAQTGQFDDFHVSCDYIKYTDNPKRKRNRYNQQDMK